MMPLQNCVAVSVMVPVSVASNNTTQTANIDTLGFDECKVVVHCDTAAAVTSNPAVCKLSEADTTTATFVAITGLTGDATDGFTIPNVSATLGTIIEMNIDLRARKRYLQLEIKPSTTAAMLMSATAVLGRAADSTAAAAKAGVTVSV